jgi:starvation-inducible DNA-binding protein
MNSMTTGLSLRQAPDDQVSSNSTSVASRGPVGVALPATEEAPAALKAVFQTKNDLSGSTRLAVAVILNFLLADAISLQTQAKQAHWNVKGPNFIGLHRLFDEVSNALLEYMDLIAKRVVQLGGTAEGTAKIAVQRSILKPYPLDIVSGTAHCEALSSALAAFGSAVRQGIDEVDIAGDKATADICTQISRGVDQWLWSVEAHIQAGS